MAKFITNMQSLSLSVMVKKKEERAVFTRTAHAPKLIPGWFVSNDKDLTASLRKHSGFGKLFTEVKQEKEEQAPPPPPEITEIEEVTTIAEAKLYLEKEHKVNLADINSLEELQAKTKELKVSFPKMITK